MARPPPLSRWVIVLACVSSLGCQRTLPAPEAPRATLPDLEWPTSAPPEGHGHVAVDAQGERANVSRVVDVVEYEHRGQKYEAPRTELLCVTPCVLDLRYGAHRLVLASQENAERQSTADVVVSGPAHAVRHALGRKETSNTAHSTGFIFSFTGSGLTLLGGVGLVAGLTTDREVDANGKVTYDPKQVTATSAAMGGVGLALLATGLILMLTNTPTQQPGATTQWRLLNGPPQLR